MYEVPTEKHAPQRRTDALHLKIHKISPHPMNPRREFDAAELQALADSMSDVGLLEPVVVRPTPGKRGYYELVAGERRLRAAALAGWTEISATVRELTDTEALEIQLVENTQRVDLNAIEVAHALEQLCRSEKDGGAGKTQFDAARLVGKSPGYVNAHLRLLRLPESWQQRIIRGELTFQKALTICPYAEQPATLARIEQDLQANPWAYRTKEDFQRNAERIAEELDAPTPAPRDRRPSLRTLAPPSHRPSPAIAGDVGDSPMPDANDEQTSAGPVTAGEAAAATPVAAALAAIAEVQDVAALDEIIVAAYERRATLAGMAPGDPADDDEAPALRLPPAPAGAVRRTAACSA